MSPLIVQKFGGTSMGTPARIHKVAERIKKARSLGNQVVVVVSAMGDTTDQLIDLAHKVSQNPPYREMDMLLSTGERISMSLLSMALSEHEVPAVSFTGSQSGIITDSSHRRAKIIRIQGDRVRKALSENRVAIVAGFQGVSESKEITTLGRGGSDTTAVGLAACLNAHLCEIYTDVDGVYSADPNLVKKARFLKEISFDFMVEMANRGARVLHPRSVELAKKYSVPLVIKSSFKESEGTRLINETQLPMESLRITSIVSDKERSIVTLKLCRPGTLAAVWHCSSEAKLSVLAPFFQDNKVTFFIENDSEREWRTKLSELCSQGFLENFCIDPNLVPLSVIGDRITEDGTVLNSILEVLGRNYIQVIYGSGSSSAITVAVAKSSVDEAVQKLHEILIEPKATENGLSGKAQNE